MPGTVAVMSEDVEFFLDLTWGSLTWGNGRCATSKPICASYGSL
jgi:hypothetical protein